MYPHRRGVQSTKRPATPLLQSTHIELIGTFINWTLVIFVMSNARLNTTLLSIEEKTFPKLL